MDFFEEVKRSKPPAPSAVPMGPPFC